MIYRDQQELDTALAYWQKVLRVQDWEVKARIARKVDMAEGNAGECSRVASLKTAEIHLLDPLDWPKGDWPEDHEKTLVHELIHLLDGDVFDEINDADSALCDRLHTQRERAVEMCACALVALKRQIPTDIGVPISRWDPSDDEQTEIVASKLKAYHDKRTNGKKEPALP